MDIKQLKFLIALDQTRHFRKAAELCHVTQPTLSMRISKLEDELGLELVRRGHRFEGFTDSGLRILAWAKTLLAAHDGLKVEAASCRGQLVGNLRLGMVPLSSFDAMELVKPLSSQYPELSFQLSSMSSEDIIEHLGSNQLDLGLCYLDEVDPERFDIIELAVTEMGLLFDERYFRFASTTLDWQEVVSVPLGMLSRTMRFRQAIAVKLAGLGLHARTVLESDSTYQLMQAVRAGVCCAVMPRHSGMESLSDTLQLLPIGDGANHSPVGLVMRRAEPRSALAEQCFAAAQKVLSIGL